MTTEPVESEAGLAVDGLLRARMFDVLGTSMAVPMVLFGFFSWFGQVGDTGGQAGFYTATGSASLALTLAASAVSLNQILAGRSHRASAPPVSAFLAGAAAILVLGGMVTKPDDVTLHVGSIGGLLIAVTQALLLTIGWVRGSGKTVKAANIRAVAAEQEAADFAAAQRAAGLAALQARAAAGQNPWATGYSQTYPPQGAYPYPAGQYPAGQYATQQPPYPPAPVPGQYPPPLAGYPPPPPRR